MDSVGFFPELVHGGFRIFQSATVEKHWRKKRYKSVQVISYQLNARVAQR
jgi:hypothetical protein